MLASLSLLDPPTAGRLLDVQLAAYRVEAELIGFEGIPVLFDTLDTLQACEETFLGWYEAGILAGAISYKTEEDVIDIHRLVVHPDYFRRGIGEALVNGVLLAFADRASRFVVATGAENAPARRLYEKLGFVLIGSVEVEPGLWIAQYAKEAAG